MTFQQFFILFVVFAKNTRYSLLFKKNTLMILVKKRLNFAIQPFFITYLISDVQLGHFTALISILEKQ